MPTINKQSPAAKPANGKPTAPATTRPVVHPEPKVFLRTGDKAITVEQAKELLGWETEGDYATRRIKENPKLKAGTKDTTFGDEYTLIDGEDGDGSKVRCWNNAKNRPFDLNHAKKLAQDILNRHWRFNGEAVIIGRTGLVISAQHRLIGLILAEQMRQGRNASHWSKLWPGPVTLDTVLVVGVSEDADTVKTIDNTKPRTLADVLYTSDVFAGIKERKDRAEVTRMLDAAIDLLWRRLGANESGFHKYQTHSESQDFLARHPKLLQCVKHLWEENQNRGISHPDLRLSPGQCAAACYLMGCSATDYSDYHAKDEPAEKHLNWEHWDRAKAFWSELAGDKKPLRQVRLAIKNLKDESELSGRMVEKLMVCAKAWEQYKLGKAVDQADCELLSEDGNLEEWPGFGGPDLGPKKPKAETEEVPDEKEREAEAARIRAEKLQAKVEEHRAKKGQAIPRAPGEVASPAPLQLDKDGKPPAPKLIKMPSK